MSASTSESPSSSGSDGSEPKDSKASASGATGGEDSSDPAVAGHELAGRAFNPLDLVLLTRGRIQDTLDEFAERGRVTRDDANELVAELIRRGREQTDDILEDLEQIFDRGRDQLGAASRKARRLDQIDRLVRRADRARRTVRVGPAFPILGYEELTVAQVEARLGALTPPQLRKVRDYERRHANRKTVLEAIEKRLS